MSYMRSETDLTEDCFNVCLTVIAVFFRLYGEAVIVELERQLQRSCGSVSDDVRQRRNSWESH